MDSLIKVEMKDGTLCRMAPRALDMFLARNEIHRFKRSDGWAVVGVDPLRQPERNNHYGGSERRLAA